MKTTGNDVYVILRVTDDTVVVRVVTIIVIHPLVRIFQMVDRPMGPFNEPFVGGLSHGIGQRQPTHTSTDNGKDVSH